MKRPGTTFRIAFALAMLSATVLLCTRLAGLFDEDGARILASRTQLCESVAIACSQFASQGDSNGIEVSLASLVVRNADVTSAGYRDAGGQLVLSSGPHANNWELAPSKTSSQNCIYVPVMAGAETSGRVELCFKPIYESGLAGILSLPSVKVTLAATCINLLAFYWLLRRSLKHLDPSRVVPDRVRSALDTMAEGLLILDQKNQIVLANQSFAETVKSPVTDLQGMDVDRFSWELADDENRSFPWNEPQASGQPTRGRCMRLGTADGQRRTFLVNATTIRDDRGNDRGMMVSLDDVTEIERKNTELVKTLNALKTSQQEVREQNEKLQFLATRDPLTSCLNRRSFFKTFEDNWKAAKRYGHPLCCVMVDVDHFKSINDNFGHARGDDVLKSVAATLSKTARETDFVCRYGGEEFCILLPHVNLDEACIAAERYREAIERIKWDDLKVTASLGVSSLSMDPDSPQTLIDQADMCLYFAKKSGRNQVARYDEVAALGKAAPSSVSKPDSTRAPAGPLDDPTIAEVLYALASEADGVTDESERITELCTSLIELVRDHQISKSTNVVSP